MKKRIITIRKFGDLLAFSMNLLSKACDFEQYTKVVTFLAKLREEYRVFLATYNHLHLGYREAYDLTLGGARRSAKKLLSTWFSLRNLSF